MFLVVDARPDHREIDLLALEATHQLLGDGALAEADGLARSPARAEIAQLLHLPGREQVGARLAGGGIREPACLALLGEVHEERERQEDRQALDRGQDKPVQQAAVADEEAEERRVPDEVRQPRQAESTQRDLEASLVRLVTTADEVGKAHPDQARIQHVAVETGRDHPDPVQVEHAADLVIGARQPDEVMQVLDRGEAEADDGAVDESDRRRRRTRRARRGRASPARGP